MKRLPLLASIVCLSLAAACDDEAARAAERRDQELAARLAELEAQIDELAEMREAIEARTAKPKPKPVPRTDLDP